jgi:ATP/maltotriose-dependent transcriptional regulator MalT
MDQAYGIYMSLGIQRSIGYNLKDRGDVLWRLGRYDEAENLLNQAAVIANKPGGELKRLSVELQLIAAEIGLSQDNFADAKDSAGRVLERAGTEFRNHAIDAKMVMSLAQSRSGAAAAGKQVATEAVEMAKQLDDSAELAKAQLAFAETVLLSGDSRAASINALQADEVFARLGHQECHWRALLIAAQANNNLGNKSEARSYAIQARDSLSKLEQRWNVESYKSYLNRPDVQRFRKQLDQLTGPT